MLPAMETMSGHARKWKSRVPTPRNTCGTLRYFCRDVGQLLPLVPTIHRQRGGHGKASTETGRHGKGQTKVRFPLDHLGRRRGTRARHRRAGNLPDNAGASRDGSDREACADFQPAPPEWRQRHPGEPPGPPRSGEFLALHLTPLSTGGSRSGQALCTVSGQGV